MRTLQLGLWTFQRGQDGVNVPAVLVVVPTALPILMLYAFGRRRVLNGLTAGFGK